MSQALRQRRRRRGTCIDALRRRRLPLVLLHLASSRGTATASRVETVGEGVRQFLQQLWNTYSFLVAVRERRRGARGRRRAGRRADRARPLGALAAAGDGRGRSPSAWTTSTRRPPAARSPPSSTISPTGTCAARAGASGTATRPPSRRCATCLRRRRRASCSRRSRRSSPTRSTPTSTAPSRRVHLCRLSRSRRDARDVALEVGDGGRARDRARSGCAARAQAKVKVRQPLREAVVVAAGREREAIERLAEVVREELNVKELRFVERGRRARLATRSSRTTARSARASASACRRWPRRSRRSTPRTSPRRCATAAHGRHPRRRPATTRSAPTTCSSRCSRSRATSSSARARTPSRSTCDLDDELRREGLAREVVHAVQNARKERRPRGRGPDRADARRRRRAARRRPRARGPTSPARRSRRASRSTAPAATPRSRRSRAASCGSPSRWRSPRRARSLGA